MNFEALFQQPNALPSAPKVVQDLITSFKDERVSSEDIARKLATDPVLSAKLLRLANSAYYHISRSVSTVNEAVAVLGFITVRTVVISSGLVNGFKLAPGMDFNQFWRYSLNTAVAAKWFAQQLDENSELAFTVGMMHGIGQLVIHAGIPEQALILDKEIGFLDARRFEVERDSLGFDYAAVGAELAARWQFPDAFSEAILAFPRPLERQPFIPMAAIIHLASWLARSAENNRTAADIRASCPMEVAAQIGLDPELIFEKMPPLSELSNGLEDLVA